MRKVFFTVGTNKIQEELMRKISDITISNNNAKPNGGLWLADFYQGEYNISPWMDNITSFYRAESLYNVKYKGNNILYGALITLKEDAKIFVLDDIEKLDFLMNKYPYSEGLFSYENLAEDYDGIYVNYLCLPSQYIKYFEKFDITSLILFNTSPIEFYQEAIIEVHNLEQFYGDILLPSNYTITVDDNKKYVNSPSIEYEKLITVLAIIAYNHWNDNKKIYNNDKRILFKYVYNYIKNNYYEELKSIIGSEENVTDLCYAMACNVLPKK